jgi:hypothetical protein
LAVAALAALDFKYDFLEPFVEANPFAKRIEFG